MAARAAKNPPKRAGLAGAGFGAGMSGGRGGGGGDGILRRGVAPRCIGRATTLPSSLTATSASSAASAFNSATQPGCGSTAVRLNTWSATYLPPPYSLVHDHRYGLLHLPR